MDIIATIGYSCNCLIETIDFLTSCNINYFRVNLSKYSNLIDAKIFLDELIKIKHLYKSKIRFMIDLAYPYQKCRIYTSEILSLLQGTSTYITSMTYKKELNKINIKTNAEGFGNFLKRGDLIIYGDGRHSLIVEDILDSNCVKVQLLNDTVIHPGKSLHIKNFFVPGDLDEEIVNKINILNPNSIALSFVSSSETINKIKNEFPEVEIISKIETREGINNILDISKVSDLMIARGDLLLNVDYDQFYKSQCLIAQTARKNRRKLYIATGILASLSRSFVPTQAEIIDLMELKKLKPDALILNYGLITGNLTLALPIISSIFDGK